MDPLILARRPNLVQINKKKITCRQVNFAFTADRFVKSHENDTINKYLNITIEF